MTRARPIEPKAGARLARQVVVASIVWWVGLLVVTLGVGLVARVA